MVTRVVTYLQMKADGGKLVIDLNSLINSKKAGKLSPDPKIRKIWFPKYCLVRVDKMKKEWYACNT